MLKLITSLQSKSAILKKNIFWSSGSNEDHNFWTFVFTKYQRFVVKYPMTSQNLCIFLYIRIILWMGIKNDFIVGTCFSNSAHFRIRVNTYFGFLPNKTNPVSIKNAGTVWYKNVRMVNIITDGVMVNRLYHNVFIIGICLPFSIPRSQYRFHVIGFCDDAT